MKKKNKEMESVCYIFLTADPLMILMWREIVMLFHDFDSANLQNNNMIILENDNILGLSPLVFQGG